MILDSLIKPTSLSKTQIEEVEKTKQEYKLIGKFIRTKGLRLFSYNSKTNKLVEMTPDHREVLELIQTPTGLVPVDYGQEEVIVDSREIQFEALNFRSAEKRLRKFKNGDIKELCNLKKPGKIDLF